jgi:hypothetical protein
MSLRIVFNGQEYTSVEAMPPDIRQEYEAALDMLSKTGDRDVVSQLQRASGLRVQTQVRRRILVDGKEYDSVDQIPLAIRQRYEAVVRGERGDAARPGNPTTSSPPGIRPPPTLPDDQARRRPLVRVAWWLGIGILLAWFLVRRT